MPTIYVDTEQAALIEAAVTMLEAALTARVKRADPDQVISNSLTFQAGKLRTFRVMMQQPDPPKWALLAEPLRRKALTAAQVLLAPDDHAAADRAWETLRGLLGASQHPHA